MTGSADGCTGNVVALVGWWARWSKHEMDSGRDYLGKKDPNL